PPEWQPPERHPAEWHPAPEAAIGRGRGEVRRTHIGVKPQGLQRRVATQQYLTGHVPRGVEIVRPDSLTICLSGAVDRPGAVSTSRAPLSSQAPSTGPLEVYLASSPIPTPRAEALLAAIGSITLPAAFTDPGGAGRASTL